MVSSSRAWDVNALGGVMGTGKSEWIIDNCQTRIYLAFRPASSLRTSDKRPSDSSFVNQHILRFPEVKHCSITSRGRRDCTHAMAIPGDKPELMYEIYSRSPSRLNIDTIVIDEAHMFSEVKRLIQVIERFGDLGIKVNIATLETDFGGVGFPIATYLRDHVFFNQKPQTKTCDDCHERPALYNQVVDSQTLAPISYRLLGSILVGDTEQKSATEALYKVLCPRCWQVPVGSPLHPGFKFEDIPFKDKKIDELNPWEFEIIRAYQYKR